MSRARRAVESLRFREPPHRLGDLRRCERDFVLHRRDAAICVSQILDPAEPTTGRADEPASPLRQRAVMFCRQPHAQFDALGVATDLEILDLGAPSDEAIGEAEPYREIGEVLRRRHQHRQRRAVIDQRNGSFFGQRAGDAPKRLIEPIRLDAGRW